MNISNYNKALRPYAQNLRNNSTKGEIILWDTVLKGKKLMGYQFNRQFAIDKYIADFICRKLRLIIEVDGYSHQFKQEQDKARDSRLKELGYNILRFTESQVRNDLDNVVRSIEDYINEYTIPLAPPVFTGTKGETIPPTPFTKGETIPPTPFTKGE